MNLLGGDVANGNLGVSACGKDVNQVFVYSGGNAGIAELALHLYDAHKALTKALHGLDGFALHLYDAGKALAKALHGLDGFPAAAVFARQPAAMQQGAACALLVAVPSILLLLGKRPAQRQDDEHLADCEC